MATDVMYKTILTSRPPEGTSDKHYIGVGLSHPEKDPSKKAVNISGFKRGQWFSIPCTPEGKAEWERVKTLTDAAFTIAGQGVRPTIADVAKPIVDTLRAIGQTDADILRMAFPAVKWDEPTLDPASVGFRVL